ncbi:MAG: hypothetical protein IJG38_01415 [Thermoguttaceae bacterium]|nr:hypothetical protein [Thermoguttaceae bacterium]
MTDKLIKCSSCGFPLDAVSVSQNRIKCPKCGVVNVVNNPAPDTENKDNPDENIIRGLPVTEKWSDVHRAIISEILRNRTKVPSDILQELKIVSAERLIIPCYLFDCKAIVHPVQQINVDNQSYAVNTQQKDPYTYSVKVFRSGNSSFQDVIAKLYDNNDLMKLVDIAQLTYPSDVTQASADITVEKAKDDLKQTIADLSTEQAKILLKSGYYSNLYGSDHEFTINYSYETYQIRLPLIHATFSYNNQKGEFYLSGDAQKIFAVNLPFGIPLNIKRKQLDKKFKKDSVFSRWGGLSIIIGILLVLASLSNYIESFAFSILTALIGTIFIGGGTFLFIGGANALEKLETGSKNLDQEHNFTLDQSIQRQIPLRGIWETSLRGNPDAFPDDVR